MARSRRYHHRPPSPICATLFAVALWHALFCTTEGSPRGIKGRHAKASPPKCHNAGSGFRFNLTEATEEDFEPSFRPREGMPVDSTGLGLQMGTKYTQYVTFTHHVVRSGLRVKIWVVTPEGAKVLHTRTFEEKRIKCNMPWTVDADTIHYTCVGLTKLCSLSVSTKKEVCVQYSDLNHEARPTGHGFGMAFQYNRVPCSEMKHFGYERFLEPVCYDDLLVPYHSNNLTRMNDTAHPVLSTFLTIFKARAVPKDYALHLDALHANTVYPDPVDKVIYVVYRSLSSVYCLTFDGKVLWGAGAQGTLSTTYRYSDQVPKEARQGFLNGPHGFALMRDGSYLTLDNGWLANRNSRLVSWRVVLTGKEPGRTWSRGYVEVLWVWGKGRGGFDEYNRRGTGSTAVLPPMWGATAGMGSFGLFAEGTMTKKANVLVRDGVRLAEIETYTGCQFGAVPVLNHPWVRLLMCSQRPNATNFLAPAVCTIVDSEDSPTESVVRSPSAQWFLAVVAAQPITKGARVIVEQVRAQHHRSQKFEVLFRVDWRPVFIELDGRWGLGEGKGLKVRVETSDDMWATRCIGAKVEE